MSDYIITQIRQADKYGNHLVDELLVLRGSEEMQTWIIPAGCMMTR